ncbi:tRNA 2-selenouridine(34) synthase MnmH [Segetibacter sp.]|jgi:tRNA 2-selenouridine synthase|uniref:tRNA 2-selenouridine(34) synthase MnmH n=1 Tax=Segetibacter sp. TaxID=2231182 RepID=UPI0026084775|nr:tRNA 2-selenouridine(34) synthase MnmH [Segetibacter sp.]MCW3080963.1 mnmH [Segetibacter sp.]
MAVTRIDIETFLSLGFQHPVIDVRSEGEFAQAHIPGAVSMPLFNNDERKVVGTAYKQQSKQQAIKIGLGLFGKKMVEMVEFVEGLLGDNNKGSSSRTVVVHCWRGGMRSGGVSWLLDLYGFKVYTIIGGYKAYRLWGLQQLGKDYRVNILGGYTGSGKTPALQELKKHGEIIIDLEELAKHKGSAFGSIGMPKQPSQEMFENLFALELHQADDRCKMTVDRKNADGGSTTELPPSIWLEDESQRIGLVNIPALFFKMMRNKPIYFLDIPFEERLKHIVTGYGKGDKQEIASAIIRIQKRLGGLETKTAINYLIEDNLIESFRILLKYYDKQYLKGLQSRENLNDLLCKVKCETVDAVKNAKLIFAQETEKVDV